MEKETYNRARGLLREVTKLLRTLYKASESLVHASKSILQILLALLALATFVSSCWAPRAETPTIRVLPAVIR